MSLIQAKICGLSTPESLQTAVTAGAAYIGFVFFEKSPRNVSPQQAADLAKNIPDHVIKTGVFVDPGDAFLSRVLDHIPLDLIQLHGNETTDRVQEIKNRFKRPVMKAIAVADAEDIVRAKTYQNCADMLLFDAKAPTSHKDALPGGNGLQFDWQLIKECTWSIPWMLSGGLGPHNITEAIAISGAKIVDVSSGVEDAPGYKSMTKITAFMSAVNED